MKPVRTYQFHPKRKPLPRHSVIVSHMANQSHGKYSVLIEITKPKKRK
jgi:hypothetical protein